MKGWIKSVGYGLLLAWVVPSFILSFYTVQNNSVEEYAAGDVIPTESAFMETEMVKLLVDGQLLDVGWEEYLTGVLLCEIPGSFHPEAKKAQAVVARTYAQKTMQLGYKHPEGAVCADPGCCQGYISIETYMDRYSDISVVEGARNAVRETAGEVVTYMETLIDATYFSCSGGRTEDAVAVWGTDIPYLQTVLSPGEESAAVYADVKEFTSREFMERLGRMLQGIPADWFGEVSYTNGGGVASIEICGMEYSGMDIRMKLGLRSTSFTVDVKDNVIRFTTKGYGHRVGMSQYGADAMGRAGNNYREIIQHYYQGVQIVRH